MEDIIETKNVEGLSVKDVCQIFKRDRRTIDRWYASGKIPSQAKYTIYVDGKPEIRYDKNAINKVKNTVDKRNISKDTDKNEAHRDKTIGEAAVMHVFKRSEHIEKQQIEMLADKTRLKVYVAVLLTVIAIIIPALSTVIYWQHTKGKDLKLENKRHINNVVSDYARTIDRVRQDAKEKVNLFQNVMSELKTNLDKKYSNALADKDKTIEVLQEKLENQALKQQDVLDFQMNIEENKDTDDILPKAKNIRKKK